MPQAIEAGAKVPGWTRLKIGKVSKYRSPTGRVVGSWAYSTVLRHYERTGEALPEPQSARAGVGSSFSSHNSLENPGYDDALDLGISEPQIVADIPAAKPTPASKTAKGLFSSRQLSEGMGTMLILATSLIATAAQLPEAQLRENEVKAISIPLANIIEKSRYNKFVGDMIVGKSDYVILGYALYQYMDRVTTALKEKNSARPVGPHQQAQAGGQPGNNGAGGVGEVPLHYAPAGLRGIVRST